jgi:hypothetical protein
MFPRLSMDTRLRGGDVFFAKLLMSSSRTSLIDKKPWLTSVIPACPESFLQITTATLYERGLPDPENFREMTTRGFTNILMSIDCKFGSIHIYFISWFNWNIGRSTARTIRPTMTPMMRIIAGSRIESAFCTFLENSSSYDAAAFFRTSTS